MSRRREVVPDFTQPREGWREVVVNGQTLYLPRGLSHNPGGSWRSTYNNTQRYFSTLEAAWRDLVSREQAKPRQWWPRPVGPKKRLDTGLTGVNIALYRRRSNTYVAVCVSQTLEGGYRQPEIGHIAVSEITQQWLDLRLCEAAAVRWHHVALRKHGKPDRVVKLEDVAPGDIPRHPVRRVLLDEVFAAVDRGATQPG